MRLWEEGILFGLVVAGAACSYVVWGIIMLSAGVHFDVKRLATLLVGLLSAGLFRLLRRRMADDL